MGPVHQSNIDDFETMIKTNINGVIYVTAAVLPKMLERQSGYIINIGSVAGTYPYFGGNCYGGTKGNLKEKKSKRRTKKKKKKNERKSSACCPLCSSVRTRGFACVAVADATAWNCSTKWFFRERNAWRCRYRALARSIRERINAWLCEHNKAHPPKKSINK